MKSDLATSVIVAVVGTIVAYFVCNMFIGGIDEVSIPVIDGTTSVQVAEPNIELFNYKALNPTVEVYVGECSTFGENGECLDGGEPIDGNIIEEDIIVNEEQKVENVSQQELEEE